MPCSSPAVTGADVVLGVSYELVPYLPCDASPPGLAERANHHNYNHMNATDNFRVARSRWTAVLPYL